MFVCDVYVSMYVCKCVCICEGYVCPTTPAISWQAWNSVLFATRGHLRGFVPGSVKGFVEATLM